MKKPRKPKKPTRKPVKASRKPAKTTRKPAKTARKPAKAARKPAKATARPAKAARKPAKATRKPAKAARTARKPASPAKPRKPAKLRKPAKPKLVRRTPTPPVTRDEGMTVVFVEAVFLEAVAQSPFPNNEGQYFDPDAQVVAGIEPADLERELECPQSFVIYASAASIVPNCGGPNPALPIARARAFRAAEKVTCPGTCTRRVNEIWNGWNCIPEGANFVASAAVEVVVVCQIEE